MNNIRQKCHSSVEMMAMSKAFFVRHLVQFYETDQMGIVHHSNYLRFFEEARVAWAHSKGLLDYQKPESAARFAVLSSAVQHHKPSFFGDELRTEVQGTLDGIKVKFRYRTLKNDLLVASGETVHVAMTLDLKPTKPTKEMMEALRSETWTET